jgi:hypothetical protein
MFKSNTFRFDSFAGQSRSSKPVVKAGRQSRSSKPVVKAGRQSRPIALVHLLVLK